MVRSSAATVLKSAYPSEYGTLVKKLEDGKIIVNLSTDIDEILSSVEQPSPLVIVLAWFHSNTQVRNIAFVIFGNLSRDGIIIFIMLMPIVIITIIIVVGAIISQFIKDIKEEHSLLKQPLIDVKSFLEGAGTEFEQKR